MKTEEFGTDLNRYEAVHAPFWAPGGMGTPTQVLQPPPRTAFGTLGQDGSSKTHGKIDFLQNDGRERCGFSREAALRKLSCRAGDSAIQRSACTEKADFLETHKMPIWASRVGESSIFFILGSDAQ